VEENLLAGAHLRRAGPWSLARVYELFPVLRQKRRSYPRTLSGGEQQMAAIGRALMANPRLLICDELSLGLAPVVVKSLYEALTQVVREGLTVIIVEQDVALAQGMSRSLYCFQEGRVSLRGASSAITRAEITRAYFGV
jgi:branched-chain amino acid transport system ATP-binding protein